MILLFVFFLSLPHSDMNRFFFISFFGGTRATRLESYVNWEMYCPTPILKGLRWGYRAFKVLATLPGSTAFLPFESRAQARYLRMRIGSLLVEWQQTRMMTASTLPGLTPPRIALHINTVLSLCHPVTPPLPASNPPPSLLSVTPLRCSWRWKMASTSRLATLASRGPVSERFG